MFSFCCSLSPSDSLAGSDARPTLGGESRQSDTVGRVWDVRLDIPDGQRSGLGVARRRDLGVLVVRLVVVPGAAHSWNLEHPSENIMEGDHIIEVNGLSEVSSMAAEVSKKKDFFDIKLRRLKDAPRSAPSSTPACTAESLVAKLSADLPLTRDLTSNDEATKVLSLASFLLSSGVLLEEVKELVFRDPATTPAILISAVGSAESKLKLEDSPSHHLTCIFAMYGEQNRIRTKTEHENGQDILRNKVKQLKWLFDGEKGKSWDILAVDDGCPHDSIGLARKVVREEGYENVRLVHLQEAIDQQLLFFTRDRKLTNTKESRKGGAILYGLDWVAKHSSLVKQSPSEVPHLVMYTDSDLSTDMSLCGFLSAGMLVDGCSMSMGARYGTPGTFLVKERTLGHPESHYDQPNMMKIVFRHYLRVRLLPMLTGIYDTQCAFKCFKLADVPKIIQKVQSMGPDFDMELLLCALTYYQKAGIPQEKLCRVYGTLFTEDFAESNFMASSGDPDKPYKTYLDMTKGIVDMHRRYVDVNSKEAKQAAELVKFCGTLDLPRYKKMIQTLESDLGPTLFDHDFGLEVLRKAAS